jgi:hypothetical protein
MDNLNRKKGILMKAVIIVILIFFLASCSSINTNIEDERDFFNQYYIKVRNNMFLDVPEYHSLKDRISRQEYRILPSYLQYYYEKE